MRAFMKTWGVLFDFDGVIADSSRQHLESWERLAAERGLPLPEGHFQRSFGMRNIQIITELLGWASHIPDAQRLGDEKEAIYRDIIRAEGITALPGVRALLDDLRANAIPCAIGSSTPRANLDCALEMLGLRAHFAQMVASEDVTHGKPDPEVFLKAAAVLGLPASRAVVIEDAHVGIEAAHRGGMRVVAVATTHPADSLRDADHVLPSLDGLTAAMLAAWCDEPFVR